MRHLVDDRIEIGADEQELGPGVLDHIGDLRRRKAEIDRHQHHVGLGGAEPELEEGRPVLGEDRRCALAGRTPSGDQAVGHLVGTAVELAIGGVLPLEMDGYPIGAGSGVVARDVADRQKCRQGFRPRACFPPNCFLPA